MTPAPAMKALLLLVASLVACTGSRELDQPAPPPVMPEDLRHALRAADAPAEGASSGTPPATDGDQATPAQDPDAAPPAEPDAEQAAPAEQPPAEAPAEPDPEGADAQQ